MNHSMNSVQCGQGQKQFVFPQIVNALPPITNTIGTATIPQQPRPPQQLQQQPLQRASVRASAVMSQGQQLQRLQQPPHHGQIVNFPVNSVNEVHSVKSFNCNMLSAANLNGGTVNGVGVGGVGGGNVVSLQPLNLSANALSQLNALGIDLSQPIVLNPGQPLPTRFTANARL